MSDRALELAYEAHRKYLDSDSADCGPIEDFIAAVIRIADTESRADERRKTAERCAAVASEVSNSYDKADGFPSLHAVGAETVAVTIRREFGLEQEVKTK